MGFIDLNLAVGELVQTAAHKYGTVGPVPFEILQEKQPMKNQQQLLTAAQKHLAAELIETYGVKPDDVTFFTGEAEPFLGYEAQSALANKLADIRDIDSSLEPMTQPDAITVKCRLELGDGRSRSGIGVVNVNEPGPDDKSMSHQQHIYTATSRALRSALRAAGIDLISLHANRHTLKRQTEFSGEPRSNYDVLLKQVHVLGEESGLIKGRDKTLWRSFLIGRYERAHSDELSEEQLADLAAALKAWRPYKQAA